MQNNVSRRDFLKTTGAAGLGVTLAQFPALGQSDASGRLRVAVVGTNGRGLAHIECLNKTPGTEVVYICDVDDRAIAKGLKQAAKGQKTVPRTGKDIRKMLEDKSIDAVTIATPDHWHAPMALMAMAAGKHVYVEKPCSHNPYEGELLVESVKKHGKVLQMGNQRRSFPNMQRAMKELHDGKIGRIYFARAWYDNRRGPIGMGKAVPVPEYLDFDLWQGPAPRRPYKDNLVHYNWHWFWHWGTGEALNNGTHEVDVCRWAMGVNWPERVSSNGGRYHFQGQDDWETPDTQVVAWDFADGRTMTWEGRSCNDYPVEGLGRGVLVYGTEGTALLEGDNFTFFDRKNKKISGAASAEKGDATNTMSATGLGMDRLHFQNFVDCIRAGAKLNSPISEGHISVAMLHLGNIAWRTKSELKLDNSNGHIVGNEEAAKLWRREYEKGWEPVTV